MEPLHTSQLRENFREILKNSTLNILFVIDTTGSMDPYRNLCSDSISLICKKLSSVNVLFNDLSSRIKWGVVGYRDKKDENQFEYLDFTNNEEEVISFVKKLKCTGGGDACEDVKGAFQQVLSGNKIHWDAKFKFVIMIADAPCHGKIYHDYTNSSNDDYPEENMEEEVKLMALNELNFIGILFTTRIEKMYKQIEKIYLGNHGKFRLIDHADLKNIQSHEKGTQNILNLFVEQVSQPIEELTKSSVNFFFEEKKISRPSQFKFMAENAALLNFDQIAEEDDLFFQEETFEVYNFTLDPKDVKHENIEEFDVNSIKINEWQCQLTINPIGKGTFRSIYLVKVLKENPKKDDKTPYNLYIAKAPIKEAYYTNPEEIKYEWRGSLIAASMAKKFNSELYGVGNKGDLTVSFNDVFILKSKKSFSIHGKQQSKYYAVEKVLKGSFTKYNNNHEFVADFSNYKEKYEEMYRFNFVAQAFSHYTFQKSDGLILVCDLQGVLQKLTDPIILTKNKSNLQGDLSCMGIIKFLEIHKCNEICKKLQLKSPDDLRKEVLEHTEMTMASKTLSTQSFKNDDDKKKGENSINSKR